MKLEGIQTIKSVLNARIGRSWPVVLLKAMVRKNVVFSKTRWSKTRGPESEFIKRMSLAPALYIAYISHFFNQIESRVCLPDG